MPDDATIHLRVPAATKGRWIRASRAAGMRLTDWIAEAVESKMKIQLIIPDGVSFSDLKLERSPNGNIVFDWDPIERICDASGQDIAIFRHSHEDNVAGLIFYWYQAHQSEGGEPDPVAEDLLAEADAENLHGFGISYQPGRA